VSTREFNKKRGWNKTKVAFRKTRNARWNEVWYAPQEREKEGAETARQGHSVRVRENEAQGRNAGHSVHASLRGNRGRQTWCKAKTTKESLHKKKNKTGFGDEENVGTHGFRGD